MTQNGVICNTGIEMSIPMNTACIVQIFREINFAKFREIDAFSAKLHWLHESFLGESIRIPQFPRWLANHSVEIRKFLSRVFFCKSLKNFVKTIH